MSNLKQWCKDAGPIGPLLWLFDETTDFLSRIDEAPEVQEKEIEEPDDFAILFAIFIFLFGVVGGISFLIWG